MAGGIDYSFQLSPGEPFTEVCLVFHSALLERKFHLDADQVRLMLHPEFYRRQDPWFSQCKMTPAMEGIVHQLCAASSLNPVFRLSSESKALELIALYLTEMQFCEDNGKKISSLSQSDIKKVHDVKSYLLANYHQQLSLDGLCKMSGLNRKKITEGFKGQFGKTIFEYIQYLRIEKSKQLLLNEYFSVGDVAERVGYRYQSNFAKAFKQQVGLSPKLFSSSKFNM